MKAKAGRIPRVKEKRTREPLMADKAMPTAERLRHANGAFQIGGSRARTQVKVFRMFDAPLQQIYLNQQISDLQFEALRQLNLHWYCAKLAGNAKSIDMNSLRSSDFSSVQVSEKELMHRQQFDIGWRALDRNEKIAVNVVVLIERGLTVAGFELGYRSPYHGRQAALGSLQSAADRLVRAWRV